MKLIFFTLVCLTLSCSSSLKMTDGIPEDYLESLYAEAQEVVHVRVLTTQPLQKIGKKVVGYTVNKINCQVLGNLKGSLMPDTIVAYHNFIEGDRVFPVSGDRIVFLIRSESWEELELWMAIENGDFAYTQELWKTMQNIARKRKYQ